MKQTVAHPCGNQYALRQKLSSLTWVKVSACVFVIRRMSRPRVTSSRETLWRPGGAPRSVRAEATAMGEAMLLMRRPSPDATATGRRYAMSQGGQTAPPAHKHTAYYHHNIQKPHDNLQCET